MNSTPTGGVEQAHASGTPQFPMGILNGYLTRSAHRGIPTTDIDHAPREFRRYVNASGAQDVQISNGMSRRIGQGLRAPIAYVSYLYASTPRIPGQTRDDYGGQHKKGMDPLSYQSMWDAGPGSQPMHPGGVRQIASDQLYNPGTS